MARPVKKGFDYFPFDVDFFRNIVIRITLVRYGTGGVLLYIYLLTRVYSEGYYMEYNDDMVDVAADELMMEPDRIREIISFFCKKSLFDSRLFAEEGIITSEIVNRQPKFIVMEDLNVKGMMKNKHLAKAVQEQCFYEFYRQIQYKCQWNNIEFITADRYYPSSKKCICCGNIKKNLKLSDRVYHCDNCGNTVDRDYQASVNLMRYYGLTA